VATPVPEFPLGPAALCAPARRETGTRRGAWGAGDLGMETGLVLEEVGPPWMAGKVGDSGLVGAVLSR
jgi:hypothetical protein